ncbi:MAG: hypothetical protein EZS28_032437 [Streblomastix strix]|uniref:Uncharacterized protein n=1 Tax=Streblomastix strix TaxID=222440 RepID=A0A5J4UQF0_9EUKA|nr:MAG: hypothetical protein EZS28_032437 [Streblomastix strix]
MDILYGVKDRLQFDNLLFEEIIIVVDESLEDGSQMITDLFDTDYLLIIVGDSLPNALHQLLIAWQGLKIFDPDALPHIIYFSQGPRSFYPYALTQFYLHWLCLQGQGIGHPDALH